jgi:hypothetical protein
MLKLEGFIAINLLLFMVLFSFVVQSLSKQVAVVLCVFVERYFESKKQYLMEMSKLDVPIGVSKFN